MSHKYFLSLVLNRLSLNLSYIELQKLKTNKIIDLIYILIFAEINLYKKMYKSGISTLIFPVIGIVSIPKYFSLLFRKKNEVAV